MIDRRRPASRFAWLLAGVVGTSSACSSMTINGGTSTGGSTAAGATSPDRNQKAMAGGSSTVVPATGGSTGAAGEAGGSTGKGASTAHSAGDSGGSVGSGEDPANRTAIAGGGTTGLNTSRVVPGAGGSSGSSMAAIGGSTAGTTRGAAGSSTASCAALSLSLHGVVEGLSNGHCRVTYDFSDSAQLLDWAVASNTSTEVSLSNQVMSVSNLPNRSVDLAAVLFMLPLRPTRLAFKGTTLEGDHMNAYLAVRWTGDWAPALGYGCIHRRDGRLFTAAGASLNTEDSTPLVPNHTYTIDIQMTASRIVWTSDASSVAYDSISLYQNNDRHIALGAWASRVAFDDIVIEGEF